MIFDVSIHRKHRLLSKAIHINFGTVSFTHHISLKVEPNFSMI